MGLMLDSSLLIADERGKFDMPGFLRQFSSVSNPSSPPLPRKARRQRHVEQILATIFIQSFDLAQARVHARVWAELETSGRMIGPHDLLIAAAALAHGHKLATLNVQEFQRVAGLELVNVTSFART